MIDNINSYTGEDILKLSKFLKILSDTTRLKIVTTLSGSEISVAKLAGGLNMTISAISHQLAVLKENKIVKARRDGKNVFYRLDDHHVLNIINITHKHLQHN